MGALVSSQNDIRAGKKVALRKKMTRECAFIMEKKCFMVFCKKSGGSVTGINYSNLNFFLYKFWKRKMKYKSSCNVWIIGGKTKQTNVGEIAGIKEKQTKAVI